MGKSAAQIEGEKSKFEQLAKQRAEDKEALSATLQNAINQRDNIISTKDKESAAMNLLNITLLNKNKELEEQINALNEDVDLVKKPLPIGLVYKSVIKDFEAVSQTKNVPYQISNLSLKLKAIVGRDANGLNMQFLDAVNMKQVDPNMLSEMILDISSKHNAEEADNNKLPNLLGYTETAVRRILQNMGLKLNPIYQHNTNVINGDSFKQTPAPNTDLKPGETITIIFSKNE